LLRELAEGGRGSGQGPGAGPRGSALVVGRVRGLRWRVRTWD